MPIEPPQCWISSSVWRRRSEWSMCGPRLRRELGFGQKSRRGSRYLTGSFLATAPSMDGVSGVVSRTRGAQTGVLGSPETLMNTKSRGSDAILSENEAIAPPARRPTLASGGGAWVAIYGSQPTTTVQIKRRNLQPAGVEQLQQNKAHCSPAPKWEQGNGSRHRAAALPFSVRPPATPGWCVRRARSGHDALVRHVRTIPAPTGN